MRQQDSGDKEQMKEMKKKKTKKKKREVVKVEPHVRKRSLTSAASALYSFLTADWHSCGRHGRPGETETLRRWNSIHNIFTAFAPFIIADLQVTAAAAAALLLFLETVGAGGRGGKTSELFQTASETKNPRPGQTPIVVVSPPAEEKKKK